MTLPGSDLYAGLIDKARWSNAHGRSVFHIDDTDIDRARLFSYGFRAQTIGSLHAARVAIEAQEDRTVGPYVKTCLCQARILLEQLEARAVDCVPRDFRSVISTLYFYDLWASQVVDALEKACARSTNAALETIRRLFLQNIEAVTSGNGIYVARDVTMPEQGCFIVPNLGISIAPVIYGDHHSWNAAFLSAGQYGVSVHRHRKGAEIHLGFSPVKGRTILGSCFAEVTEGYAMPIPPMTDHGFENTSGHDHVVPFIFGSSVMSGWGVFFDVEPRSDLEIHREDRPLESAAMNHSVALERAIRQIAAASITTREVLIPAGRAGSPEIGGLELTVTSLPQGEMELSAPVFRIVSVQSGRARVRIAGAEAEFSERDHFGVPAGLPCYMSQLGEAPLVFLDAMMLPVSPAISSNIQ